MYLNSEESKGFYLADFVFRGRFSEHTPAKHEGPLYRINSRPAKQHVAKEQCQQYCHDGGDSLTPNTHLGKTEIHPNTEDLILDRTFVHVKDVI